MFRSGASFGFVAFAVLAACQTTQQGSAPANPPAEVAALKQKWEGTCTGTWGGSCTGSIKVSNVRGNRAHVLYSWGICGDAAPGSYVDRAAIIDGDKLIVSLSGRTQATYVHVDENTLRGSYERPRDGATATGLFKRGG